MDSVLRLWFPVFRCHVVGRGREQRDTSDEVRDTISVVAAWAGSFGSGLGESDPKDTLRVAAEDGLFDRHLHGAAGDESVRFLLPAG